MAANLKMKAARSCPIENQAYWIDNGGRRLGIERRQFDYSFHIPERRVGLDRRVLPERRAGSKRVL
jgi:hypothetical protein